MNPANIPYTRHPKPRVAQILIAAALSLGAAFPSARAQTSPAATAADQAVALPTFTVSSEKDTSFEGAESVSLTRLGVDISDIPQSVAIINKSYLDAVSPTQLQDMLQYVGGAQVGNIDWAIDRFAIRGFTSQGDFVDGFLTGPGGNSPSSSMYFMDHMEVIKGPAAIMSTNASGVIGGAVNQVTLSPAENQVNSLSVEYGRYNAGHAVLDVGGAITPDKKLLFRLLLLGQDEKGYYDYTYDKRTDIMPMLTYNFSSTTQAWVKFESLDFHFGSYNGIPLDGRTNEPMAVAPNTNFGEDTPENWRFWKMWRLWGQFTTHPNDHVSIRFAAFDSVSKSFRTESIMNPSGTTTPTLQANGTYAYAPYVQYVIPPTYVSGQLITRTTTADVTDAPHSEMQNDYAINFNTGPVSHKLLLGADISQFPLTTLTYSAGGSSQASSTSINPFLPDSTWSQNPVFVNRSLPPTSFQDTAQTYAKMFALETAGFFDDRLQLTYGASRHRFDESQTTIPYSQVTGVYGTQTYVPSTVLYKNLVQYGIVVKPLKNLSLFYGYNANFAANPIQAGAFLPPQEGTQKETGIKTDIIPGRLHFTASYFEIYQINNTVPAFPQTSPPTQILIPGETSRGFDGDFTVDATKNLALVGSFAAFNAHIQEGFPYNATPWPFDGRIHQTIPVDNVSQNNFAVWARYLFTDGTLKGLSIGIGENTLAKRAITDSSNQIMYGYVPGYSVVNANVIYETRHYKFQVNVDNVFNTSYWLAVRSNQIVIPALPINPRASVTYKY